jgi:hypothetical protein
MTAAETLNSCGLLLNVAGGVLLFIWRPPQPTFEEAGFIAPEGVPDEKVAAVRALKRRHAVFSKLGVGLIVVGFLLQLAGTRPVCASMPWTCQVTP